MQNSQSKIPISGTGQWQSILEFYNPWWTDEPWPETPRFKRDLFHRIKDSVVHNSKRALLIHGPRRVGKTTLIRQVVQSLIHEDNIDPRRILYFPLDHDDLLSVPADRRLTSLEEILETWWKQHSDTVRKLPYPLYAFLDEVQGVVGWQHVIKSRYLDQDIPIRFVLTGSSSQQVIRDAMEDMLDRIEIEVIRPGSFREYIRFQQEEGKIKDDMPSFHKLHDFGKSLVDNLDTVSLLSNLQQLNAEEVDHWHQQLYRYFSVGGFLRYWGESRTLIEEAEDLDRNYIQLVGLRDLRSMRAITNAEPYLVLLRYFFARPGCECNTDELKMLTRASRQTVITGIDLILRTELVYRVDRFRKEPGRERSVHAKFYPCDPALSVATSKKIPIEDTMFAAALAETTVCAALRRYLSESGLTYYRPKRDIKDKEVDFIARIGTGLLPIEIKFQQSIHDSDTGPLRLFAEKHGTQPGILLTRNHLGIQNGVPNCPLSLFLLLW